MKKTALFSFLFLFILGMSAGCVYYTSGVRGSGDLETETREISGVTGVNLATIGELTIVFGGEEKLVIEADDNLLEYFESEVRNGVLRIDTRSNTNIRTRKHVRYTLTVKSLERIALSSSGDIVAPDLEADRFTIRISSSGDLTTGTINTGALDVRISSSGDAEIDDLYAEKIDVNISSSGNLQIHGGNVEEQDITISSSGDYKARRLDSRRARVHCSSSGNAYLRVKDHLRATLSSSGDVYYYGNPEVEQRTTSSGDVIKRRF